MSLVGSLEDLGLGDILQIISLSRKSGVLFLHCEQGEGRIVFQVGLVHGAFAKGGPTDLAGLVLGAGALSRDAFERLCGEARTRGEPLPSVLAAHPDLGAERLEGLRRAATESAVVEMFRWRTGEFSFEMGDEGEAEREAGMLLAGGLSAQYLAMEATRLRDEADVHGEASDPGGELVLSGDESDAASVARAEAVGIVAAAALDEVETEAQLADDEGELALAEEEAPLEAERDAAVETEATIDGDAASDDAEEAIVTAQADSAAQGAEPSEVAGDAGAPATPPAVVAIDRDLATLEWIKSSLRGAFPRVHIFQRTELGIERIRQYLSRGEAPVVILSTRVATDPWSGARDAGEVVDRLKSQAPRTPILVLTEPGAGATVPARADGSVESPGPALANPRRASEVERAARQLEHAIRAWAGRAGRRRPARDPLVGASPDVGRLKRASARLRDPASRGEVLPIVMQFAAESFARVAILMLRDEIALGIAQIGLARAGGPDDAALRGLELPIEGSAWLRRVRESRAPLRGAPEGEGDLALARALGARPPREAYLAPIESGDRVVAVLYADQLPGEEPIGDTSALEIVLHEAGLAVDRAVLERALAESEG
jgi:hypothetical protein